MLYQDVSIETLVKLLKEHVLQNTIILDGSLYHQKTVRYPVSIAAASHAQLSVIIGYTARVCAFHPAVQFVSGSDGEAVRSTYITTSRFVYLLSRIVDAIHGRLSVVHIVVSTCHKVL